jgi:DNA polymerase-3 subunit chi
MKVLKIYSIQESVFDKVVVKIILKLLQENQKLNLITENREEMLALDKMLWTFSQLSFLPHCTEEDEFTTDLQKIFISTGIKEFSSQFDSAIYFSAKLFQKEHIELFDDIFIVSKQGDEEALISEEVVEDKNIDIKYFIQNKDGSWKS